MYTHVIIRKASSLTGLEYSKEGMVAMGFIKIILGNG